MATEIAEGGQAALDAFARMRDTIMNLSGTHTGPFLGHAPSGKRFTVRNVQVPGFRDGRMSDRWGSTDELGILQQLGLL